MPSVPSAMTVAFRCGQLDALVRTLIADASLYPAEKRTFLGLRLLSRTWQQYREDRAIPLGERLIGAECAAERNAFLTLVRAMLPPEETLLASAIALVHQIAVRPLREEAQQTARIVDASQCDLDAVRTVLATAKLPADPLARIVALVDRFRYSSSLSEDGISSTAHTPCWALNLAASVAADTFRLSELPFPVPAIVRRRHFRADIEPDRRRRDLEDCILEAIHQVICDIAEAPQLGTRFATAFPDLRAHSRLAQAWLLLRALGGLTPAQLARGLSCTKAGAAKLLRQLEARQFVRQGQPFAPFSSQIKISHRFP